MRESTPAEIDSSPSSKQESRVARSGNFKKLKLLHTADIHLRDRQYARSLRGDDFRNAFHKMIDVAIEEKVDAIINGGDTFQINRPGAKLQAILMEGHGRLVQAGIPMLSVTGNHDTSSPSFLEFPALADYYEGMTEMPEQSALADYLKGRSMENRAGIVCIDHSRYTLPNGMIVAGFPADVDNAEMLKELQEAPADIVVWHGAVNEFVPFPMNNSLDLVSLDIPGVKAWLLGDIHLPNFMRTPTTGAIVSYPGPIEFCESGENAVKKVDIYEVGDAGAFPDPRFVTLPGRPVVFLSVADEAQADQACAKVMETQAANPGKGMLVFLRYDKNARNVVHRLNAILDPRDSVLLSGVFQSRFLSTPGSSVAAAKPSMEEVVSEVVPDGSRLHNITLMLSRRGVNSRQLLSEWVDAQLQLNPCLPTV